MYTYVQYYNEFMDSYELPFRNVVNYSYNYLTIRAKKKNRITVGTSRYRYKN